MPWLSAMSRMSAVGALRRIISRIFSEIGITS
jgi:hypothetical protein